VTEQFIRQGNYLTIVGIVTDPVYLAEPFIRSSDYLLDETHVIPPHPCEAWLKWNGRGERSRITCQGPTRF
jgi:hypothetical protein